MFKKMMGFTEGDNYIELKLSGESNIDDNLINSVTINLCGIGIKSLVKQKTLKQNCEINQKNLYRINIGNDGIYKININSPHPLLASLYSYQEGWSTTSGSSFINNVSNFNRSYQLTKGTYYLYVYYKNDKNSGFYEVDIEGESFDINKINNKLTTQINSNEKVMYKIDVKEAGQYNILMDSSCYTIGTLHNANFSIINTYGTTKGVSFDSFNKKYNLDIGVHYFEVYCVNS